MFSLAVVTNYHKSAALTTTSVSSPRSVGQKSSRLDWSLCLEFHKAEVKGLAGWVHLQRLWKGPASKLIPVVGKIQFPAIGGLRSLFPRWFSAGAAFSSRGFSPEALGPYMSEPANQMLLPWNLSDFPFCHPSLLFPLVPHLSDSS